MTDQLALFSNDTPRVEPPARTPGRLGAAQPNSVWVCPASSVGPDRGAPATGRCYIPPQERAVAAEHARAYRAAVTQLSAAERAEVEALCAERLRQNDTGFMDDTIRVSLLRGWLRARGLEHLLPPRKPTVFREDR